MQVKTLGRFINRFLKQVKGSSQYDKLFPGYVGKGLKEYIEIFKKFSQEALNKYAGDEKVELGKVYPKPINQLFKSSSMREVNKKFKEMEKNIKDGEVDEVQSAFLGVIIVLYILIMKNLYIVGTAPVAFKYVKVSDDNYDFNELGISKKRLKKLIPILDYIDMDVDDLVDVDVEKSDINYFHIILRRLIKSEV